MVPRGSWPQNAKCFFHMQHDIEINTVKKPVSSFNFVTLFMSTTSSCFSKFANNVTFILATNAS